MDALQLAGQLILENGGETYRAEETIRHMGAGFHLRQVESFAIPSGLLISCREASGAVNSSVKRIRRRGTNLTLVNAVNAISREVFSGRLTPSAALARLLEAAKMKTPMSGFLSVLSAALCAGGFTLLFHGRLPEVLAAMFVAAAAQAVCCLLDRFHSSWIAANILGGFLTALLPALLSRFLVPTLLSEAVVAGALMPLVPGIAMTNAVQDTMRGDLVSGISHGVEALLTACLIAGGALLSPAVLRFLP